MHILHQLQYAFFGLLYTDMYYEHDEMRNKINPSVMKQTL